jgi:molybdate transport system regulatory protein
MSGQISNLQPGPVNTEVTIYLETGDSVVATVTRESAETLGLEIGKPALAVFKASAVILAVPV